MDYTVWIIGILASTGTGICMLPQLIKVVQTHKTENLSKLMLVVLVVSLSLWIVYGVMKKDVIIIVSNAVSLSINIALLILSFTLRPKPPRSYF